MKHHKKNSKRQKLSLKYNIQKRVRESKRRIRKEAKRIGVSKNTRKRKDPGIPNSWPFKAEMLQELERKKEQKDEEIAEKRAKAKAKAKKDQKRAEAEKRRMLQERDEERRKKRSEAVEQTRMVALVKVLTAADVVLEVLDARDPWGCRCAALEAWVKEKGKRLVFVLAKADLVAPAVIVQWLQALGREGPAIAVQAEAGREGVAELLQTLGRAPKAAAGASMAAAAAPEAQNVGVVGYAGTGKKALCKAMRQEAKGVCKWLLESIGRLQPQSTDATPASALHLVVRGMTPKGAAWNPATSTANKDDLDGPLAVVAQLLQRTQAIGIMRRFRLPAFNSPEELLRTFARDKDMKSRKGKETSLEAAARRLLAELPTQPGCYCAPPEVAGTAPPAELWALHNAPAQATMRAAMEAQAAVLAGRDSGHTATALVISSGGLGSPVDVAGAVAGDSDEKDGDAEMEDDDEDDLGDLEEGEEEDMEGDESEEDMSDGE